MKEGILKNENSLEYEPGVLRVLQSKSEREAYYNKIAMVYDLLAENSERAMREAGLVKLAATPGERILEIGFGTGHCLVDLAKSVGPTGKVFGIDISENMVSIARELMEKSQIADRVEAQRADAEALPYSENSMDAIFMSFTLELFDTPEIPGVLAQCKRILRPGGRIVVVGVSKEGKQGIIIKAFEWTHRHFPNLMDCRPIYVARALAAAGFIVQDTTIDHMWVPVEIVLAVKS
jgi:demethylmenaquinone methyltransferase/2-methoxy-6-polyprenyl-1,4-benzoquinol methylase